MVVQTIGLRMKVGNAMDKYHLVGIKRYSQVKESSWSFPKPSITQDFASMNILVVFYINNANAIELNLETCPTMRMKQWDWFYYYHKNMKGTFSSVIKVQSKVLKQSMVQHKSSPLYQINYLCCPHACS